MDRDDDVERLFSWIKTPDLHYREFAAEREVADAVATWPALRDAVPEPSPSDKHLEPEGGSYEDELLPAERARHFERPAAVFGHHEPPLSAQHPAPQPPLPPPPREEAREVPWAEAPPTVIPQEPRAAPTIVQREPAPTEAPPAAPSVVRRVPPPPSAAAPEPPRAPPPVARPSVAPQQAQASADQDYRGFEETDDRPPAQPEHTRETRSLDAIFSRVAHPARAPRDGRKPPSGGTGLGPVFRRLR